MTNARRFAGPALLAAFSLAGSRAGAQCAMCQSVVAQSPEAQAAAGQLNLAILVMFVAPYLVVASFAVLVFRDVLKDFLFRVTGRLPLSR